MKQFDVVPNSSPRSRDRQPFLVLLQSDLLSFHLDTVLIAPLERASARTFVERLNPHVTVNGQPFRVIIQQLAAIPKNRIGKSLASLASERAAIIAALDLLCTGF
jgi:toxin CcdB